MYASQPSRAEAIGRLGFRTLQLWPQQCPELAFFALVESRMGCVVYVLAWRLVAGASGTVRTTKWCVLGWPCFQMESYASEQLATLPADLRELGPEEPCEADDPSSLQWRMSNAERRCAAMADWLYCRTWAGSSR